MTMSCILTAFFLLKKSNILLRQNKMSMHNPDRRYWLKMAGLAGMGLLVSRNNATAATHQYEMQTRPLPNKISADDHIRLGSNENPYGPSEKVRKAIKDAFDLCCRYPWSYHNRLIQVLAKKHGVSNDHIVLCAGSNEGLRASGLLFGGQGQEIVAANPSYLALLTYAEQFGTYVHKVPLKEDLQHDLDAMARRVSSRTSMIFVCNPNNPTGSLLPAETMLDFCETMSERTLVFSDEAYFDYVTDPDYPSMTELVKKDKNVIVSRTFSKIYGLAGIRAGYLIARPDTARRLRSAAMASMSVPAVFAALASAEDEDFYRFSRQKNKEALQQIYKVCDDLKLEYTHSHANFAFVKTGRNISTLQQQMREEGVIIGRPFPPLTDWARISSGTLDEMKIFDSAFRKVMGML
jgi:histidinol-phosphate aminotransferase